MKNFPGALALCCACATIPAPGSAVAGPIAESSEVVGRGHAELEIGIATEKHAGQRARSTPLQLKLGVLDALELRLETDGAVAVKGDGASEHGYADASIGLKWRLREADEGRPGLALLADADVDSGSAAFRGEGLRPSLRLFTEWKLPGELSLNVTPGVLWDRDDSGGRYTAGSLAVALTATDVAPGWHGFVELAGHRLTSSRNGGDIVSFRAGVAWEISELLQLELQAARGLNDRTPTQQWVLVGALRF